MMLAFATPVHAAQVSQGSIAELNRALGIEVMFSRILELGLEHGGLAEFNKSIDATQRACVKTEFGKHMGTLVGSNVSASLGSAAKADVDAWLAFVATPAGKWFADTYSAFLLTVVVAPSNAHALTSGGEPDMPAFPTPPAAHREAVGAFMATQEALRVLAAYGSMENPSEEDMKPMMKAMEPVCRVKFEAPNY